jgi:hypothetical protein
MTGVIHYIEDSSSSNDSGTTSASNDSGTSNDSGSPDNAHGLLIVIGIIIGIIFLTIVVFWIRNKVIKRSTVPIIIGKIGTKNPIINPKKCSDLLKDKCKPPRCIWDENAFKCNRRKLTFAPDVKESNKYLIPFD